MRQVASWERILEVEVTVESHSEVPRYLLQRGLTSDRSDKNARLTLISLCSMTGHPHGHVDSC